MTRANNLKLLKPFTLEQDKIK